MLNAGELYIFYSGVIEKQGLKGNLLSCEDLTALSSDLINPDIFLSNLKLALDSLSNGDIEFYDLGNEIGRVSANLSSPSNILLREVIYGVEHGFDMISNEMGAFE